MSRALMLLVTVPGLCLLGLGVQAQSNSPPPTIKFSNPEIHRLESRHVGAPFTVRVLLPPTLPGEDLRFPVVYMTDATGELIISDTMIRLMMLSDTPRFITVGIGYPAAAGYFQTMDLRQRDLTPVADPTAVPRSTFEGTVTPPVLSGGAAKFLDFIREELIPFIDATYPTGRSGGGCCCVLSVPSAPPPPSPDTWP